MNNKALIFSAPSGSGKSTIVHHILDLHPEMEFSVSATTRPPRGEEKNGVEYYFMSLEEFNKAIENDELVEYQEVYPGRFYGTLKSEVTRINKKGNHEVLVRIGYNAEMAKEAAKNAVRDELEKKGENLHNQLDKALGF